LLLAAAVMFIVPVLVLFVFAQQTFVEGAATEGVKG
jgi:ABC-type maltose transport system permease subunit